MNIVMRVPSDLLKIDFVRMKTIIFSFLILLISLNVFSSEIVISAFDRSEITVNIDGYPCGGQASELVIGDLVAGNHLVEIFALRHTPRKGFSFIRIYNGEIFIPVNSRIYANVNVYNDLVVTRNETLYNEPGHGNGFHNGDDHHPHHNNSNGNHYGNHGNHGFGFGMNEAQLTALKHTMMNASFDSNKLNLAKSAIAANGISSSSLLELMALLSFDSNRLELAKFSYPYLVDKGNAFVICNGFTFSSNADEFLEYIH